MARDELAEPNESTDRDTELMSDFSDVSDSRFEHDGNDTEKSKIYKIPAKKTANFFIFYYNI